MWPSDPSLEVDSDGHLTYDSLVNLGKWIREAIQYHDAARRCPDVVETPL